jgi:hypothetical protein
MLASVVFSIAGLGAIAQAVFNINQAISQLPACTVHNSSSKDLRWMRSNDSQGIMFGREACRRQLPLYGHTKLPLQEQYTSDRAFHLCSK